MIEVVDYDPAWPDRFAELSASYCAALASAGVPIVAIEHVGSTAVPGLASKPVIDIDIVVEKCHVDAASAVLESLGFEPRGNLGVPERSAFKEPPGFVRTNTYVVVLGSLALKNHLSVRDALRRNGKLRDRYAAIKREASRTTADIDEYGHAKSEVIQHILSTAGLSTEELSSISAAQHRLPNATRSV